MLDLGAGTGLLAAMVARAHPEAELVLLDGAGEMLAGARERLGDRASYVTADLGDPLPEGPWDAVVSALAIHHLDARRQAGAVRARPRRAGARRDVRQRGQVLGPTPELDAVYCERHRAQAFALGVTAAEWEATLERMSHDRCDTVADQLAWLAEAGFTDVDSPWRSGRFAVLAARRAWSSDLAAVADGRARAGRTGRGRRRVVPGADRRAGAQLHAWVHLAGDAPSGPAVCSTGCRSA